jgi:sugar phosphate isomerase/epimerase
MEIRIGNQTSGYAPARAPYEFARRHGFDAFEWFSDRCGRGTGWCETETTEAEKGELRRLADADEVRFSIHAPHDADPTTRAGADAVRRSISFGGEIGARVVNLHFFPERPARAFVESLKPLLEDAFHAKLLLSLENTPATAPDHVNAVFGVLSGIAGATDGVGLCLDSGHANLHAGTRNDYLRFVDLLGDHVPIVHWHAHENWGDRDAHLPLFTGPSGANDQGVQALLQRLKARGFAGSIILEQWPHPPEQLIRTRTRLSELLATEFAA